MAAAAAANAGGTMGDEEGGSWCCDACIEPTHLSVCDASEGRASETTKTFVLASMTILTSGRRRA